MEKDKKVKIINVLFNETEFKKYIAVLETIIWIFYLIFVGGAVILGFIYAAGDTIGACLFYSVLFGFIAFVIAWISTLFLKIKVQEMKWKVDMHNWIIK